MMRMNIRQVSCLIPSFAQRHRVLKLQYLILTEQDHALIGLEYTGARIICIHPYVYFAQVSQYFAALSAIAPVQGIHPTAWVSEHAIVDPSASIGPHVAIEAQAVIAANAVLSAGVVIGRGVVIGESTKIYQMSVFMTIVR